MIKEVKYKTVLSNLKKGEKPCYQAIVVSGGTVSEKELVKAAADRIGLPVENVELGVKAWWHTLKEQTLAGKNCNIPDILYSQLSIRGTFDSADEQFDAAKHKVRLNMVPRGELAASITDLVGVNVTEGNRCRITSVMDTVAKREGVISSGENVDVWIAGGTFLVDTTAEDEGVWLENAEGTVVAFGTVTGSTSTTLDATFASLPEPGEYKFVVATRGGLGKEYGVAVARRNVTIV